MSDDTYLTQDELDSIFKAMRDREIERLEKQNQEMQDLINKIKPGRKT